MKLLFICSGNTCRSPMAMCLAGAMGHEARSAGLAVAWAGDTASEGALYAMQKRWLSLDAHRSHALTRDDLVWADKVICVSTHHAQVILQQEPDFKHKLTAFDPPIPDPYKGANSVYEAIASDMAKRLPSLIEACASS